MYDSIHIDDFTIDVRETKLGPEMITRDIPNVAEAKLAQLDADGIIRIGASVSEGDILVERSLQKERPNLLLKSDCYRRFLGKKQKT
jgi:DNA-directed RNA polymerase subunit beta